VEINSILILVDLIEIELKRVLLVAKYIKSEAAFFLS
jgi:hypothetical protein